MHHFYTKETWANFAKEAQPTSWRQLFDLASIEIQKAKVEDVITISCLHDQLSSRPKGNLGMKNLNLNLAINSRHRVTNSRDARFVFITDRQVQGKVPIVAKANLREFLRQRGWGLVGGCEWGPCARHSRIIDGLRAGVGKCVA
jgi:hypothetical protein